MPFWVTLLLMLTSDLISRFFMSNVSFARPIPLGAFNMLLGHVLLIQK